MEKKENMKKRMIILCTLVLLAAVLTATGIWYYHYTKPFCTMESVEHMGQREGVSMDNILVEIEYYTITAEGEYRENCLYVFENGDIYSGYSINYRYLMRDIYNEEQNNRINFYWDMDNRYWDYLYDQCYWGRLSCCELNDIRKEFSLVESYESYDNRYYAADEPWPDSETSPKTQGNQIDSRMEEIAYAGHYYVGRAKESEEEVRCWISRGSIDKIILYMYDEHAHNAIDIVKSTWAYEQWTNQIFGEGWEERIDLEDDWGD